MAEVLVLIAGLYVVIGAVFAIAYVLAIPAGFGFRAIIFPGVTALWPLLLKSKRKTEPDPQPPDSSSFSLLRRGIVPFALVRRWPK